MSGFLAGVLEPAQLSELVGHPVRGPIAILHQGPPLAEEDRRIMFVAEAGADVPVAVVKWARGAAAERLHHEQAALELISSCGDPVLAAGSPNVFGSFSVGHDSYVTVQRCIPGRSVYIQLRSSAWPRRLARGHFDAVATWLARFTSVTQEPLRPLDEDLLHLHIEEPLRAAALHFGSEAIPNSAVQSTLRLAREHLGMPVRPAAEHGDLWSANLLADRSGLGVVDWDHFRRGVLPGFDMLLFSAVYGMDFPWRPFGWSHHRIAFERTFLQPTWLNKLVLRLLQRGCSVSGLPPSLVPVMLPVTMCRMALRRVAYLSAGAPIHKPESWLDMLQAWWVRPADNSLEAWAGGQSSSS